MKIVLRLITAIAAAAVLICFSGCSMNTYPNADKYTVGNREINDKIKNLDIDWVSGDITISFHDSDTVKVEERCSDDLKDSKKLHTWVDGDTLHVRFCKSGEMMLFKTPEKDLEILLPKDTKLSEMSLDGSSCDCDVRDLTAETIKADVSSGDLKFIDCSADTFDMDTSSGNVTIVQKGSSDSINIDTSSGDAEVTAEKVGKVSFDTSSGDISVNVGKADRISTDASSGRTEIKVDEMPSKIKVDSSSGDVTLRVPRSADFEAEIDTSSGEFYSELSLSKNGDTYISGSGGNEISIDTSSGDISIISG